MEPITPFELKQVNAWMLLGENNPDGTNYFSPNSQYQRMITKEVYKSVDFLFICFVTSKPTDSKSVPTGDGGSYTLSLLPNPDWVKPTMQDAMDDIIVKARAMNQGIKIMATFTYGTRDNEGFQLENIFQANYTDQQNASNFADNVVAYLRHYNLDGFDFDWEWPLSDETSVEHFTIIVKALSDRFKQELTNTGRKFYLTISPAINSDTIKFLPADLINNYVDFVNLQLYYSTTLIEGCDPGKLCYGAKFEPNRSVESPDAPGVQSAEEAYNDNKENFQFSTMTVWRVNSQNFEYEQDQLIALYNMKA